RQLAHRRIVEARDLVVLEIHDQVTLVGRVQAAFLEVIQVVPTVPVERVRNHGRAEEVTYLAASHSHLQLIDGARLEEIALLDVHAVNAALQEKHRGHGGD